MTKEQNLLRAWMVWLQRSGDGTMADRSDGTYQTMLSEWIKEGWKLAEETEAMLKESK